MAAERDQSFSHYRLIEKIGAGGMGVVWKAEDTVLHRTVAIKVLPADLALDEERRRMFLQEARLAASLSHAHIVQVYELGREGDLDFIAMEYVEGPPLSRRLQGRSLAPNEVADIGVQVAEGLARAHRKGLIHRDIKPSNILVTPEGEVKIVDFGLAVLFEAVDMTMATAVSTLTANLPDQTQTRMAGTLPYMSPEQVRGERLDARSDIFSFGAVLYEMTAGQRPFAGTPAEVVRQISSSQPLPVHELLPAAPLDLKRIIEKSLAPRPADRYQHMDDVAVDLRRLGKDIESGSAPSFTALRPVASRRWRRGLAVLAIVTVVVVGGVLLMPRAARHEAVPAAPLHDRSAIAVLPFQNLSEDDANAYFAGGLQDELLTQLAKVAALDVIGRTSVMGYRNTSKPLKTIASELGVGSLVEGSVQVVGTRLRVNVQLIDAANNIVWAEHYDRTLDDAFAIQSEVAQRIVAAVGAALSGPEKGRLAAAPTANAEAYRLYLQAREYYARPGVLLQDRESAQQLYERALALDPSFALAHAELSLVHGQIYWLRYDPSAQRAAAQYEEAAIALRLAPDLPEAHMAMSRVHYQSRRDYQRALDELAIAVQGLPNDAEVWRWIGTTQRRLGNWNEVFAALEKAEQLDPRNANVFYTGGGPTYGLLHRYPEAVREYDRALNLAPNLHAAAVEKGWTYVRWQGQLDTLRTAVNRLPVDADLGSLGDGDGQRAKLGHWERNGEKLLQVLENVHRDVFTSQEHFLPRALYMGWAHRLRGDDAAAKAAFESARVLLDATAPEPPDDWRVHAARGLALSGLGRRDEARAEARWLQECSVYHKDAFDGPRVAEDRAQILAQVGDAEPALDEIRRLLTEPSSLTVNTLQLNPLWDPIRDDPRFQSLLESASREGQ